MKPISEAWVCQLEITNFCGRNCLYCSRYQRHLRKDQRYHMSLKFLEKALDSLKYWPGKIGAMGGEPILHPEFEACCELIRSKFPKDKMGLWTSGGKNYDKLKPVIDKTFGFVAYNEHNSDQQEVCKHQPITLSIKDLVPDKDLRDKLINDCCVQKIWAPAINPKGGFFCEIAAALDLLLDGPGGYELTPDWWKKSPKEYKNQVDENCGICGMAIPYERELIKNQVEKFSPSTLKLFRDLKLPNVEDNKIKLITEQLDEAAVRENCRLWTPGNYREDIKSDENAPEGHGSSIFDEDK